MALAALALNNPLLSAVVKSSIVCECAVAILSTTALVRLASCRAAERTYQTLAGANLMATATLTRTKAANRADNDGSDTKQDTHVLSEEQR